MSKTNPPGARREVPRTRGALSGIALIALGLWGALIPFIGPYFNFSFTPDDAWHWSAARGWLEVLPGAAAFVAGLLLLTSKSRLTTLVAAWLGVAAGAWFAVGPQLQSVWHIGSPGRPAGSSAGLHVLEVLALFTLLGVVIVYFAATAFGRLSVVSLRDARAAERREAAAAAEAERERQIAAARDRDAAAARERDAAEAAAAHERTAAGSDDDRTNGHGDTDADEPVNASNTATTGHAPAATPVAATRTDTVDAADTSRGSHSVTADSVLPAPTTQPQQVQPAYQGSIDQGSDDQGSAGQGYAQPQQYDPQHGYARPAADAQDDTQPDDTQREGLGRRLFHRR